MSRHLAAGTPACPCRTSEHGPCDVCLNAAQDPPTEPTRARIERGRDWHHPIDFAPRERP